MQANEDALRTRVRQVIGETGLTHIQFANEVQLDPDKLSKSLNGVRRFTTYELAVIAERGQMTVDWLLTGVEPERIAVAARAQERGLDSALDSALRRASEIAGVSEILQRLKIITKTVPPLPTVPMTGRAVTDGPRLADATISILQRDTSFAKFRDDPARVIESALGIHVLIEPFGAGFDGLACATSTFRLAIVNSEIPWSRQRFTLLHSEPVTEDKFAELVGRYRVSPDALAWRLKTLGLVDTAQRADLGAMPIQQAALRGGWTDEYRKLTRTQGRARPPLVLADRAVDAFVKGTISARPVAALLQIDSATLLEWHASAGSTKEASSTEIADEMAVFAP